MRKLDIFLKSFMLATFLMISNLTMYAQWTGNGTVDDPFQIRTVEDLALLADSISSANGIHFSGNFFRLENDLDLNVTPWNAGTGWLPIGINTNRYFGGNFDGNGHTVSNLYINTKSSSFYDQYFGGLFGAVSGGTIRNLGVLNSNISIDLDNYMYIHCGALAGTVRGIGAIVANCYATGHINTISTGAYFYMVGGLVGYGLGSGDSNPITFSGCYSSCTVQATGQTNSPLNVGGLIGTIDTGILEDCYATGDVTGSVTTQPYTLLNVGGLLGSQNFYTDILRCYATGKTVASGGADMSGALINHTGGVVGMLTADLIRYAKLNNCVAINTDGVSGIVTGRMTGGYNVGFSEMLNNFAEQHIPINGNEITTDSVIHGSNVTMEDLRRESFYKTTLTWDIPNVWNIWDGNSLPYFAWQSAPVSIDSATKTKIQGTFLVKPVDIKIFGDDGEPIEGTLNISSSDWNFVPLSSLSEGNKLTVLNYETGKSESYPVKTIIKQDEAASFIITASSNPGGRISPEGSITVAQGESQSFEIIEDKGYSIDEVLVDGVSVGAMSSYLFSDVIANHTIIAKFKQLSDGITEVGTSRLMVYPNPVITGEIFIDNGGQALKDIQLFDVTGRLLHEKKNLNNTTTSIDVTNLPNGIYFLKVGNNNVKILKQ